MLPLSYTVWKLYHLPRPPKPSSQACQGLFPGHPLGPLQAILGLLLDLSKIPHRGLGRSASGNLVVDLLGAWKGSPGGVV